MVDFIASACRTTAWLLALTGFGLTLPTPVAPQSRVDAAVAHPSHFVYKNEGTHPVLPPPALTHDRFAGADSLSDSHLDTNPHRRRDDPLFRDHDPDGRRGTLAIVGGLVAGFGVGLAVDEPAAGLLVGAGVGMIATAFIRAFSDG